MSGGGGFGDDRPSNSKYERHEVDVNVNVKTDSGRPRCKHENYVGECLLCEREHDSNTPKD